MVLYEMVSLNIPYFEHELSSVKKLILDGLKPSIECIPESFAFFVDILRVVLVETPALRPSAEDLYYLFVQKFPKCSVV